MPCIRTYRYGCPRPDRSTVSQSRQALGVRTPVASCQVVPSSETCNLYCAGQDVDHWMATWSIVAGLASPVVTDLYSSADRGSRSRSRPLGRVAKPPLVASGGQVRELRGGGGVHTAVVWATTTTKQIVCLGDAEQSMGFSKVP